MAMPLRWKTSGLLGSRRAHAATNHQSAANLALISRLLGVHWPFIDCEGARQRCTHVAAPFPDTFLRGDVTVTYDHVQPRLARRPPRARLRGGAVHQAEGRRGARGDGAGRVRAPAGRLRRLRQRGDELIPDRYVRRCCMKPLAGEVVWPALLLTLCSQWLQPPGGAREMAD